MTIALTCTCAARLEVDEKFAGQTITCPDCHGLLHVPEPRNVHLRTSGFALASLTLALVGAFTVLGTLLAVPCGLVALWRIRERPDDLAGRGYALAGIVLGVVFTGLSLFAYSSAEIFGFSAGLRQAQWLARLDHGGDLEVKRPEDGFAIKRPSRDWGVWRDVNNDPFQSDMRSRRLLLVNPAKDAWVICWLEPVTVVTTLRQAQGQALETLARLQVTPFAVQRGSPPAVSLTPESVKDLPAKDDTRQMELVVDRKERGGTRRYLIRLFKKDAEMTLYVAAAGAPRDRFAALEPELREAVDSFQLTAKVPGFGFGN